MRGHVITDTGGLRGNIITDTGAYKKHTNKTDTRVFTEARWHRWYWDDVIIDKVGFYLKCDKKTDIWMLFSMNLQNMLPWTY